MTRTEIYFDPKVIKDQKGENACWEEGVEAPPQKIEPKMPPVPEDPPEWSKLPKHHYPQDVGEQPWQEWTD